MNKYEIYSKDNCSYCDRVKDLFKFHNIPYEEKNLSNGYSKEEIQARVGDEKKINTVPQIFVNGEYLGGFLEIVEFFAYDKHIT
jgi:thioredoxin reductase (NADPH)